jgi:hypothetical protein
MHLCRLTALIAGAFLPLLATASTGALSFAPTFRTSHSGREDRSTIGSQRQGSGLVGNLVPRRVWFQHLRLLTCRLVSKIRDSSFCVSR